MGVLTRRQKVAAAHQNSTIVAEYHVLPWSDVLNDPYSVAILLQPSASATAVVRNFSCRPVNVEADTFNRKDTVIGVPNVTPFVAPFVRLPNTYSQQAQPVRMSDIMSVFNQALAAVQSHLPGAP